MRMVHDVRREAVKGESSSERSGCVKLSLRAAGAARGDAWVV